MLGGVCFYSNGLSEGDKDASTSLELLTADFWGGPFTLKCGWVRVPLHHAC